MAVFNHTAHKKLWDWLSKNPDKKKRDWPEWEWNGGTYKDVEALDFACVYECDAQIEKGSADCECVCCPLGDWNEKHCCIDNEGLHFLWQMSIDSEERAKLARQIRDMPVKDGVKTI